MSLQTDSAALAVSALKALQTAVDTIIAEGETSAPSLSTDSVTFLQEYIDNHVGGLAGTILKSVLGVFSGQASTAISAPIVALLSVAKTRIDADLAALEAKV